MTGFGPLGFVVMFVNGHATNDRRYSFNQYPLGTGYEGCWPQ